jgi:hypothetical protein
MYAERFGYTQEKLLRSIRSFSRLRKQDASSKLWVRLNRLRPRDYPGDKRRGLLPGRNLVNSLAETNGKVY